MRTASLILITVLALSTVALGGCSSRQEATTTTTQLQPETEADIVLTSHNPISILNYQQARQYSAQGRYELAREHFLLAYAAAEGNTTLRGMLQHEIKGVDLMIRTLR